jgi:hypothetical protein
MEDSDNQWQYGPPNYLIRYGGLRPGKHKLIIQGSNGNNDWTGSEKTLLIMISPAFWSTWWFRITATLFIFGLFYAIIRYRLRQKFLLQVERAEKERQMAELKQKGTELEMQALRAQMNHILFLIHLILSTASFCKIIRPRLPSTSPNFQSWFE